jgi:hypothetical protein
MDQPYNPIKSSLGRGQQSDPNVDSRFLCAVDLSDIEVFMN